MNDEMRRIIKAADKEGDATDYFLRQVERRRERQQDMSPAEQQQTRQMDDDAWAKWANGMIDARMDALYKHAIGQAMSEYFRKRFDEEIAPLRKEIEHVRKQAMISNHELAALRSQIQKEFESELATTRAELRELKADVSIERTASRHQFDFVQKRNGHAA
jgi:hypothetical protein